MKHTSVDWESVEGLPHWSDPIAVWLDIDDGRPTMYLVLLSGEKNSIIVTFLAIPRSFFILVTDNAEKIPKNPKELYAMATSENIDVGIFATLLKEREKIWALYNWVCKTLENCGFIMEVMVVEKDGSISSFQHTYPLNKRWEMFFRMLSEQFSVLYNDALKDFTEGEHGPVKFTILGPTHLFKQGGGDAGGQG